MHWKRFFISKLKHQNNISIITYLNVNRKKSYNMTNFKSVYLHCFKCNVYNFSPSLKKLFTFCQIYDMDIFHRQGFLSLFSKCFSQIHIFLNWNSRICILYFSSVGQPIYSKIFYCCAFFQIIKVCTKIVAKLSSLTQYDHKICVFCFPIFFLIIQI